MTDLIAQLYGDFDIDDVTLPLFEAELQAAYDAAVANNLIPMPTEVTVVFPPVPAGSEPDFVMITA
jgi:hypothetical protein